VNLFKNIIFETKGAVAHLTISRPAALNALNGETLGEMAQVLDQVKADPQIRVLIITGAGEKSFIAGADIKELDQFKSGYGNRAYVKRGQQIFRVLETMGKPSIAAINGFALGGGCELALACTIRIAAEKAKIGLPEITLGLIPGYGGTQRLPRVVGRGKALEMILSGLPVNAQEALRIGLVSKVVPDGELMKEAEKMAELLCKRAPIAMRLAMEAVGDGIEMSIDDALSYEANMLAILFETEDKKEGVRAFIEKRPPVFKGE